jgi:ectoine hydroxylase
MNLRSPPLGFTRDLWERFVRDGILVLPQALSRQEAATLVSLIEGYAPHNLQGPFDLMNVVEMHPRLSALIDGQKHIGFIYDVFGESSKLLLSQFFIRPANPQAQRNDWHFDGPRQVPFQVFAPNLPLRIKVGYWLTDLPEEKMGNLIFLRGSHRRRHLPEYCSQQPVPNEECLKVSAGTITLMFEGLWHRVDENLSDRRRINIFYEYGPAWITASDRWRSNLAWLQSLNREQRILMRDYDFPNSLIKPPAADVPLFDLRPSEADLDSTLFRDSVEPRLRSRRTWLERNGYA